MAFKVIQEEKGKIPEKHMFGTPWFHPLGTVHPVYRTGVSLLSRERFLYI